MENKHHIFKSIPKKQYFWEGEGLLSIKTFFGGEAMYQVKNGSVAVKKNTYLILNDNQHYSIEIESFTEVESFIVFFKKGFVEDVFQNMVLKNNALLDNFPAKSSESLLFFERTYPFDNLFSPFLLNFRQLYPQIARETLLVEENLHFLAEKLIGVHQRTYSEVECLPFVKKATREEIYRRLHFAKEYMHAFYCQNLSLEELAQIACLSVNHFLRNFKHVFHCTPSQYLTHLRLQKAKEMLLYSFIPVSEICDVIGYESIGSFSSLFKKQVGVSPAQFRLQKKVIWEKQV